MTSNDDLLLNQVAQGVVSLAAGFEWFLEHPVERRQRVLRVLADMVYQTHPTHEDVQKAIQEAGLKPTYTPCVLILKANTDRQLYQRAWQISELPEAEHQKGFLLLMRLLGVADQRRRETECRGECTHWWHQDLTKM